MKFPGEAAERVARSLLEQGPASAGELADRLGMSAAGVRRPLGALVDLGYVVSGPRSPFGPAPVRRRGRPSQVFSLTADGRLAAGTLSHDELALEALRFVHRILGEAGIEAFARERAERLVRHIPATGDRVQAVAQALTDAGYAASVEGDHVPQLCQHHCPIVEAASEFPTLCDAETAALSDALGRHVTRLATLAGGAGVCTSVIGPPRTTAQADTTRKVPA